MRAKWGCMLLALLLILPQAVWAAPEKQRYYFTQLGEVARSFYTALEENMQRMKTDPGPVDLTDYFENNSDLEDAGMLIRELTAACRALEYDAPDLFWFDSAKIRMYTSQIMMGDRVLQYKVRIEPGEQGAYFAEGFDAENVEQARTQVRAAVETIAAEAAQQESSYDQIRVVHDRLVRDTDYDQDVQGRSHTAYGALVEHLAVCDGYAGAFQLVMDQLGIPCISVSGMASSGGTQGPHRWNAVQLDGKWYGMDVTWDDPVVTEGFGMLQHTYFLTGEDGMSRSHTPEQAFFTDGPPYTLPPLERKGYETQKLMRLWDQFWEWVLPLIGLR